MADRKQSPLAAVSSHPAWQRQNDATSSDVPGASAEQPPGSGPPTGGGSESTSAPGTETASPEPAASTARSAPAKAAIRPKGRRKTAARSGQSRANGYRVEWNVHSRTVRSGLMAWAATRDRVQDRADDVRELVRSAGAAVTKDDLAAIVRQVAENSGYPTAEVAEVVGLQIES